MFGTGAAILSHVHVEEKKEKLIFQGKQEKEEMGKKKQIGNTRWTQKTAWPQFLTCPFLSPEAWFYCLLPLDACQVAGHWKGHITQRWLIILSHLSAYKDWPRDRHVTHVSPIRVLPWDFID